MKKFQKIVVVIDANEDFSGAPDGLPIELRKALRLVSDGDATELKLISVGYERYLSYGFRSIGYDYMKLRQEYCGRLAETMDALAARLKADGRGEVGCEVAWAHPRYEQIVNMAQAFGADLLIQHCRSHAQVRHHHLTHDSWELVRHCPLPLLLVKDRDWGDPVTLIAAVDPVHQHSKTLKLDHVIIDAARSLAAQAGGAVHAVHAFAEKARPFAAHGRIRQEHQAAFDELMASYGFPGDRLHLIDETPVYALGEFSGELGADVIVMGAISRSRLSEALVGSTAETVLDYVKTDVLIVKPEAPR